MSDMGTVLVTGASRGIGAACVRLLARDGHDVAINYARSADAANQLVDEVKAAGRRDIAIKADVGVEADVEHMFDTLDAEMPPLAGLINNAGILFAKARVDEMGPDRINDTLRINVTGSFMCARQAIRRMSAWLEKVDIQGVPTNIPLLRRILADDNFLKGDFTTAFLEVNPTVVP